MESSILHYQALNDLRGTSPHMTPHLSQMEMGQVDLPVKK